MTARGSLPIFRGAMSSTKKVLFVCTGNTCRSPMAEAMFRKAVEGRGDYSVKSAGIAASKGSPVSLETKAVCDRMKAPLDGFSSQPVSSALLQQASHVFAMTGDHLAALEDRFPGHSDKFYLACEFVDLPGKGIGADVPDPIGMGKSATAALFAEAGLCVADGPTPELVWTLGAPDAATGVGNPVSGS